MWNWIVLAVLAALALLLWGWHLKRSWNRTRLNSSARKRVLEQWALVQSEGEPHRKLLGADAVLDVALAGLGYQGTLGEKLKRAGSFVPDLNEVWRAHKIRNRIAHEAGIQLSEREVQEAIRVLEKTIHHFCR